LLSGAEALPTLRLIFLGLEFNIYLALIEKSVQFLSEHSVSAIAPLAPRAIALKAAA
jgi:hypothetical protein